jgi:hypothetical protein
MRGFRRVVCAVVALLLIALILTGCAGTKTCKPEKVYEKKPIMQTFETYAEEPYTEEQTKSVGQKCVERHYSELNESKFSLSVGEPEWLGQPPVLGESNNIRRIVTIFNARDEIDIVYLDKIYLYNGTETKRSKTPMKFMIDPKSSRTLYVLWDTQYDPLKDVTLDFTNNTELLGFETTIMKMCVNETEKVNVTKYRKVVASSSEEIVGYDSTVKVKLPRKC